MGKSHSNPEELRNAYLFEKALADKLKSSTNNRKNLYRIVYNEYYEKYPHHPFIGQTSDLVNTKGTRKQLKILKKFIRPNMVFAEIGPGTGVVSFEISKWVQSVYMIDISDAPTKNSAFPENVKLVLSNGINLPTEIGNLDLLYSNQVMEHLHYDDAEEQLEDILKALKPGGLYLCVTPHRYSGPHDISRNFDDEPTCLHLREYTVMELIGLFEKAGFTAVKYYIFPKTILINLPHFVIRSVEALLRPVFPRLRRGLSRVLPLRYLFNFLIVGIK